MAEEKKKRVSGKGDKAKDPVAAEGATPYVGTASLRNVRLTARKARLVVDLIRGKQAEPALQLLQFNPLKGAKLVRKLLQSAIANARENHGADVDRLWVVGGWVDAGSTLKRFMPRARGSASPILKRSAHVTLKLGER